MSGPAALDRSALEQHPLPPVVDGDKDSKGRILVIAGSREVPGAALLAAHGAMRSGAGKLSIATVESAAGRLAMTMPEARVLALGEADDGGFSSDSLGRLGQEIDEADSVVAGPGVARGDSQLELCKMLIARASQLALDAALLRCLGAIDPRPESRCVPLLLPHSGELAAMLGTDEAAVEADPLAAAADAARSFSAIVVAKGAVSHVVTADGSAWRYDGGAPGLGVSGSGDVLAGIAGGLLARGADPLAAMLWAVWLHGEAGAALAREVAPVGFLAREIAGRVPALLPR